MWKLSQRGLKNTPIVANELVKFLAKNNNVEAIEALNTSVGNISTENIKLKTAVKELTSTLDQTTKVANKALNNAASTNNAVEALAKKVKALQDKIP